MAPSTTRIQLDAALRRYPAIDRLLGALLRLRCEAANPECFLLALLLRDPSDDLRDKLRRCLSFCLGIYLVYLGSSWFDEAWHLVRFEAISAYSLGGRAARLAPMPPPRWVLGGSGRSTVRSSRAWSMQFIANMTSSTSAS
jgi:hypothetical protein